MALGVYDIGKDESESSLQQANRSWRYAKCLKQWRDEKRRFIDAQSACMEQEGIDLSS